MLKHESTLRVRYGETDKMGVVYYGTYSLYYEVGRTELMRFYGITYKSLEDKGIQLPVLSMECSFLKSAFYDDTLIIRTFVKQIPRVKIKFDYEIYKDEVLINTASTTLLFYDSILKKPVKMPEFAASKILKYFEKDNL